MRNIALAYASNARKALATGHTLESCSIDPNHPAVKRIIAQLPADHTDKRLGAMLAEIKKLVDLEFAKRRDMPDTAKPLPYRIPEKVKYFADGKFDKAKCVCVCVCLCAFVCLCVRAICHENNG